MCAARDAAWIGLAAVPGTAAGVVLANALSGATLRFAFAAFLLLVAARLVLGARRRTAMEGDPAAEAQP